MQIGARYKELVKNIGFFTISNIAVKFVLFLLVPLYTYYLSDAEYGITDMLTTTINLALPLMTLSISDAVLRYCVEDANHKRDYVSIGFFIVLISTFVAAVMSPLLDLPAFGGLGDWKSYYLVSYFLVALQTFLSNVARGLNEVKLLTFASISSSICNIVLAFILIAFEGLGVKGFFLAYAAGNLFGCVHYIVGGKYWRLLVLPDGDWKSIGRRMLLYSLPLVPNSMFWWINQSVNRLFLTSLIGIGVSGLYAAASKIPGLMNTASSIFQQAWNLSAFKEGHSDDVAHFYSAVYGVFNAGMSIVAAVLIPASPFLAKLFLQKDFYTSWTLIPILLLAFYYSTISAFYGTIYTATLHTRNLFITTAVGSIICIVTTGILVSLLGIWGAALASAIANGVVWLLRLYNTRKIILISSSRALTLATNVFLIISACSMSLDQGASTAISIGMLILILFAQGKFLHSIAPSR